MQSLLLSQCDFHILHCNYEPCYIIERIHIEFSTDFGMCRAVALKSVEASA